MSQKHSNGPAKAGIMVHGLDAAGKHCLLVGYNDGRFAKNSLNYVLPKGSVDKGEMPFAAALRELREETCIDLARFLGEENIARIARGEVVENITHPDFPGVRIIRFDPRPHAHIYHSRAGVEQSMVMYGVEVEGIENLAGFLKNAEGISVKELLAQRPEMPRFDTFLSWLKQGCIPARGALPREELIDPGYFASLAREYTTRRKIINREDWQEFWASLPKEDYKLMRGCCSAIKNRVLEEGWIKGDTDILKLDEKDCPLFYYAEGAHIGQAVDILSKTLRDMSSNRDYARAFGGEGTKVSIAPPKRMMMGQVAAYSPFVSEDEWHEAARMAASKAPVKKGIRAIVEQHEQRTQATAFER